MATILLQSHTCQMEENFQGWIIETISGPFIINWYFINIQLMLSNNTNEMCVVWSWYPLSCGASRGSSNLRCPSHWLHSEYIMWLTQSVSFILGYLLFPLVTYFEIWLPKGVNKTKIYGVFKSCRVCWKWICRVLNNAYLVKIVSQVIEWCGQLLKCSSDFVLIR